MSKGILLIEDDKSLNRAVSLKLSKEGYEVYSAETLKEGWELYQCQDIVLIICDIGLPDGSGLDFCSKVRAIKERTTVFLFLTAMDTETDIIMGYEVGGDDYVTKPFSLAVLISKVNAMMNRYCENILSIRKSKNDSCIIKSVDIIFDKEKKFVIKGGEQLFLTANEQRLLLYFLENPMKVLSKNQLLEAVWDVDGNFVDDNTVAVNIRRLREKIGENPSKPSIIKNIRGLGYIWERKCEKL